MDYPRAWCTPNNGWGRRWRRRITDEQDGRQYLMGSALPGDRYYPMRLTWKDLGEPERKEVAPFLKNVRRSRAGGG